MTKNRLFLRISLILTLLLLVAAVMVGCGEKSEGEYTFEFSATFLDKTTKGEEISTSKDNIGDALLEAGIIGGEDSQFGLTVYTVYGVEHDFNKGNVYWKLYVNGEESFTGISQVKCSDVKKVEFRAEEF